MISYFLADSNVSVYSSDVFNKFLFVSVVLVLVDE